MKAIRATLRRRLSKLEKAYIGSGLDLDKSEPATLAVNVVNQLSVEIANIIDHRNKSVYLLALAARNFFELICFLKFIRISTSNIEKWKGQRVQDEIDFLSGLSAIAEKETTKQLVMEIVEKLKARASEANIAVERFTPTSTVAEAVKMKEEYDTSFRLLSKFIHPTSWSMNDDKHFVESPEVYDIIWLRLLKFIDQFIEEVDSIREGKLLHDSANI